MFRKAVSAVMLAMLLASTLALALNIEHAQTAPSLASNQEVPLLEWTRTYGGINPEQAYSMVQTSDGGYALAGYSDGGLCLVKTDSAGNMQWNKTYGGLQARSLIQTVDGGYAIEGDIWTYEGDSILLVKTDSEGNMQWNKKYGGTDVSGGRSMVQTTDGGYAIAGGTNSYGAGYSDFWLIKTDSLGNALWNKTYGGSSSDDWGEDIVQTVDEGYAIVGNGFAHLVKTDADGNQQWNKTYGGTYDNVAYSLVQTGDGGYAIAGMTWGAGGQDYWLVKTDLAGNTLWNKAYGGAGIEWLSSMVQTADGGYALAGYTDSYGAGSDDFYLVKTDSAGDMQWNRAYGREAEDWCEAVVQTVDGGYALAGSTVSYDTGPDFWLVELKMTVPGDVNGDGKVDALDLADLAKAYGSTIGSSNWNINCDINGDFKVEVLDLFIHGKNYGKTYP